MSYPCRIGTIFWMRKLGTLLAPDSCKDFLWTFLGLLNSKSAKDHDCSQKFSGAEFLGFVYCITYMDVSLLIKSTNSMIKDPMVCTCMYIV